MEFTKENNIPSYIFEFRLGGFKDKNENTVDEIELFTKNFNFQYCVKTIPSCFGDYIYKKEDFEKQENKFLLENELKENRIENIILTGLIKSDCIKQSLEDAIKMKFKIYTAKDLMDLPQFGNKFYKENCEKYFNTNNELIDYLKK